MFLSREIDTFSSREIDAVSSIEVKTRYQSLSRLQGKK